MIKAGLRKEKLCQDLVLLVEDTSREVVNEMMKMHGLIDVLIPRGGAGLIANVVANSTVPVIETGTGNCHVYVDETADISMAADIIENAKTQRMGVCNACESLVIHSGMLEKALLPIVKKLSEHGIEIVEMKEFVKYVLRSKRLRKMIGERNILMRLFRSRQWIRLMKRSVILINIIQDILNRSSQMIIIMR